MDGHCFEEISSDCFYVLLGLVNKAREFDENTVVFKTDYVEICEFRVTELAFHHQHDDVESVFYPVFSLLLRDFF